MKKILVTTDYSANSKKAIRFAVQLAKQSPVKLIFFHVVTLEKHPSMWEHVHYEEFQKDELIRQQDLLKNFVKKMIDDIDIPKIKYECVSELGKNVGDHILSYAKEIEADFICTSSRGAGVINKLFGTVATHLIVESPIPVFVIPQNYKTQSITSVCYASDIENIDSESKKVLELANLLKAKLSILHYDYDVLLQKDKKLFDDLTQKFKKENTDFLLRTIDPVQPLYYHIKEDAEKTKPSVLVLFTKQNRDWFDRLFLSGVSSQLSFNPKIPMLIYRKEVK